MLQTQRSLRINHANVWRIRQEKRITHQRTLRKTQEDKQKKSFLPCRISESQPLRTTKIHQSTNQHACHLKTSRIRKIILLLQRKNLSLPQTQHERWRRTDSKLNWFSTETTLKQKKKYSLFSIPAREKRCHSNWLPWAEKQRSH